ncbi:uncharacterized protein METZ01_LOCUS269329 [marine metagenome]|uniref:Uncharacterized protein n=1 Tax=marine metagenome TaxID=408172 RepID=A0A382JXV0_9ZZZZ
MRLQSRPAGTIWDEIAMFYPVIPEQAGIQNVLAEFLF